MKKRAANDDEIEELTPLLPPKQSFFEGRVWGCILITLSAVTYGLSASCVSMATDIPTLVVISGRFIGAFTITLLICCIKQVPVLSEVRSTQGSVPLLLVRSIFGVVSFGCGTYAFQGMPVGEATVIVSMAPLFVSILSVCMLKEKLRIIPAFLVIASFIGVFFITDPLKIGISKQKLGVIYFTAAGAAVGQALSKAVVFIYLKKSKNKLHFLVVIFWYTLFGCTVVTMTTVILYYILSAAREPTNWIYTKLHLRDYLLLGAISFLGFIAQITLTRACQLINTTLSSLIRNADILVTFLFQILYFKTFPCWIQIGGIILMLAATIGMIVYNAIRKSRE